MSLICVFFKKLCICFRCKLNLFWRILCVCEFIPHCQDNNCEPTSCGWTRFHHQRIIPQQTRHLIATLLQCCHLVKGYWQHCSNVAIKCLFCWVTSSNLIGKYYCICFGDMWDFPKFTTHCLLDIDLDLPFYLFLHSLPKIAL